MSHVAISRASLLCSREELREGLGIHVTTWQGTPKFALKLSIPFNLQREKTSCSRFPSRMLSCHAKPLLWAISCFSSACQWSNEPHALSVVPYYHRACQDTASFECIPQRCGFLSYITSASQILQQKGKFRFSPQRKILVGHTEVSLGPFPLY